MCSRVQDDPEAKSQPIVVFVGVLRYCDGCVRVRVRVREKRVCVQLSMTRSTVTRIHRIRAKFCEGVFTRFFHLVRDLMHFPTCLVHAEINLFLSLKTDHFGKPFRSLQSAKFQKYCSITAMAAVFPRDTSVICSVVRFIIDTVCLKPLAVGDHFLVLHDFFVFGIVVISSSSFSSYCPC